MKKHVFIKDELYTSSLHNNFENYLNREDDLKCYFAGSEKYKIKLMIKKEAEDLLGAHPMLLSAHHTKNKKEELSLVSFGGEVYDVPLSKMIKVADKKGLAVLASFERGTSEAQVLSKADIYTEEELKKKEGQAFLYLSLVNLEDTDVYYLITNPTLVQSASHIEIDNDTNNKPRIEQIRNKFNTIRDSIFGVHITPQVIGNTIISGGLCTIELLKDGMINEDDREEFFSKLKLKLNYRKGAAHSFASNGGTGLIALAHSADTPFTIEIENKLMGNFINKDEELRWEYIITSLDRQKEQERE